MSIIEFNSACPIGNYCFGAALLSNKKIRKEAMPFDWLFTTPKYTAEVIKNDFKDFLDKSYYVDIGLNEPDNERQAGHSLYHENFFNHKDPRLDGDYDYYVRCVDRFRDFMKKDDKKLFLCFFKNEKEMTTEMIDEVLELNKVLSEKTTNHHLMVHINFPYKVTEKPIISIDQKDNLTIFQMHSLMDNHGLGYGHDLDAEEFEKAFNSIVKYVPK
jgi:hypothetical protein